MNNEDYLKQIEALREEIKGLDLAVITAIQKVHGLKDEALSELKAMAFAPEIKHFPNDYVWKVDAHKFEWDRLNFKKSELYLPGKLGLNKEDITIEEINGLRAKLDVEKEIGLTQTHVHCIAYGKRPDSSGWNYNESKEMKWWYNFGGGLSTTDWYADTMVSTNKESLLQFWGDKYNKVVDDTINNFIKERDEAKARKIEEARKILQGASVDVVQSPSSRA